MARQFEDDDDFEDETQEPNLLKDLRKQLREARKQLETVTQERDTFAGKARVADLSDVIKSKGLDPRVAKLYPKDAEATPEAVDAWVSEYADIFGLQPKDEENAEPSISPADQQALLRMQNTQGTVLPPTRANELAAKIAAAKTPEELTQILSAG